MTSDHLDISFVWKLLVASCVCVAEFRTCVFNVFVSNARFQRIRLQRANAFVSSAKSVRLRTSMHKTRSLLAINAFACNVISYSEVNSMRLCLVASDKQVCLQRVISCSEVSSRGYLVASDDAFVCSVISYSKVKIVSWSPSDI